MAAQFGSNTLVSGSTHSPQQPQGNMFKLRLELFSFERETIESQITSYLEKLLRKHPTFKPDDYKLLHLHDVLQFHLPGEHSTMPAFDFFAVEVQLVQSVQPSRVYLTATLRGFENHFPRANYIDVVFHPVGRSTVLRLSTPDGFLNTPPVPGLSVENELIVAQFNLNILMENLSFSTPPFQAFTPAWLLAFSTQPKLLWPSSSADSVLQPPAPDVLSSTTCSGPA